MVEFVVVLLKMGAVLMSENRSKSKREKESVSPRKINCCLFSIYTFSLWYIKSEPRRIAPSTNKNTANA